MPKPKTKNRNTSGTATKSVGGSSNNSTANNKKNIRPESLLTYARWAMKIYGSEVNENRAMPDYRDGYRPVARRIMYSMSQFPQTGWHTAARLVGDVLGRFHPHGDSSVYGAIDTLVNAPTPFIDGDGNWGTPIDGPAAMRYTKVRQSKIGALQFQKAYMAITDFVPNYDDKDQEPVVIPTPLPNILLLGEQAGIGVGTTAIIPSYEPLSVIETCIRLLKNEKLEAKDFADALVFKNRYGGVAKRTKENRRSIVEFYKTGRGRVEFEPNLQINMEKRTIRWDTFADGTTKPEKLFDRLREMAAVQRVDNTSSKKDAYGISFEITLKKLPDVQLKAAVEKIRKLLSGSMSYVMNVTERVYVPHPKDPKEPGTINVKFHSWTVPQLLIQWLKWRCKTEAKALQYRIGEQNKAIRFTELMILAADNLKVIFDALKTKDPAAHIAKGLKISVDDANIILDRQVRTLSALNKAAQQETLKKQKAQLKELQTWLEKPVRKVAADLESLREVFVKATG